MLPLLYFSLGHQNMGFCSWYNMIIFADGNIEQAAEAVKEAVPETKGEAKGM